MSPPGHRRGQLDRPRPRARPREFLAKYVGRGGNSSSFVGQDYREFTAGKNKLRVQGGRVTANGKEYGPVKSGDSVLLDTDGTVSINGEKR
jgi:hypothetical protein